MINIFKQLKNKLILYELKKRRISFSYQLIENGKVLELALSDTLVDSHSMWLIAEFIGLDKLTSLKDVRIVEKILQKP